MIFFSSMGVLLTIMFLIMAQAPLHLCLSLIMLSFFVSLSTFFLLSKWVAYSLMLIFLGGMMVVFLYVSSLSLSDKAMAPSISFSFFFLLISSIILIFFNNMEISSTLLPYSSLLSELYSNLGASIMVFLITYLLIALSTVVKLAASFKGALLKSW